LLFGSTPICAEPVSAANTSAAAATIEALRIIISPFWRFAASALI